MTTATARTFIYGTSHSSISTPVRTGVASTLMSSLAVGGLQTSSQFGHLRLLSGRTSSIVCANRFVAHRDADERFPELPLLATALEFATDTEPMRGLQRRALERARLAGLDRISVAGGFAYSDVRRAGVSALIVHAGEVTTWLGPFPTRRPAISRASLTGSPSVGTTPPMLWPGQ